MSITPPRIGLFGGSFDPPHLAHLALGRLALDALALDELRWLPAGVPWQKAGRQLASAADRTAMLEALLDCEPRCVIDPRELLRAGPSYTVDTVRELAAEHPGAALFLILGQDQYAHFDTWRDWPELLQKTTLAVAARAGQQVTAPPALAALSHQTVCLNLPAMSTSATDIRKRLAAGQAVVALVGDRVAGYIDQHQLYTQSEQPDTRH